MNKLSNEIMESTVGGSCGFAIGVAVLSGALVVGATVANPAIWLLPKTWFAASSLVAGNAVNIGESC